MTKSDKHLGRVKPKHKPEKPPAEMMPVKRRKKPEPRYRAEHRWERWKVFNPTHRGYGWLTTGSSNDIEQAIHIAKKQQRSYAAMVRDPIRVIDTTTGKVVWEQAAVKP